MIIWVHQGVLLAFIIKHHSLGLLGLHIVRAGRTKRLTQAHGKPSSGKAERENGLHLHIVGDGLVHILGILGVILRQGIALRLVLVRTNGS